MAAADSPGTPRTPAPPATQPAAPRAILAGAPAPLPPGHRPALIVLVNAEEEFDWDSDFDRAATSVSAMSQIGRAQGIFDAFRITPTYVVDYPVASQAAGAAPLREIAASGRACIGAHLHPWVTPPHDEALGVRNSFPGNLPRALEAAKLAATAEAIERGIGVRPRVYQAGRYGIGPNTAALLIEQGFTVDLSVSPPFDYSAEGGPDFSSFGCDPFWVDADAGQASADPADPARAVDAARPDGASGRLLAVPLTGSYVGLAGRGGHALHRWASGAGVRWTRLPGLLARAGVLDRLRLSPEGFDHGHHRRLTRELLAHGVRTFVFSFHAPSLQPGCTQYVRSDAELAAFLDRLRRYFDWFLGELNGVSLTPLELRAVLSGRSDGARAPAI